MGLHDRLHEWVLARMLMKEQHAYSISYSSFPSFGRHVAAPSTRTFHPRVMGVYLSMLKSCSEGLSHTTHRRQ